MAEARPTTDTRSGWRSNLPIHPAAEIFPLMPPDELRVLSEDIVKTGGPMAKIVLWRADPESSLQLLDGRNRLDAIEMVTGKPVEVGARSITADDLLAADAAIVLDGRSIDPWDYVISANVHRRHLSAEQRQKALIQHIARTPEKSDRQIAKEIGVDHKTIGSARTRGETTGEISPVEKRIGKDGKARKQPTTKATGETSQDHRPSATRSGSNPPKVDKEERFQHALAQLHERNEDQQDALRGLREDKRALEIKVLALESEVGDLKRENERLKAALKLAKAPPAAPDDGLDIPASLRREAAA